MLSFSSGFVIGFIAATLIVVVLVRDYIDNH